MKPWRDRDLLQTGGLELPATVDPRSSYTIPDAVAYRVPAVDRAAACREGARWRRELAIKDRRFGAWNAARALDAEADALDRQHADLLLEAAAELEVECAAALVEAPAPKMVPTTPLELATRKRSRARQERFMAGLFTEGHVLRANHLRDAAALEAEADNLLVWEEE